MWALQLTAAAVLLGHALLQLKKVAQLRARLVDAQEEARYATDERRSERAGRVKAEREVRALQLRLGQLQSSSAGSMASQQPAGSETAAGGAEAQQQAPPPQQHEQGGHEGPAGRGNGAAPLDAVDLQQVAFPLRPIGLLRSCFSRRNGTPRQPLLVPAARARLALRPELSATFLEGLEQYSHCWVLYLFHENTDLQRLWQAEPYSGVPAKIRVPRLNGGKMGAFATRSPHRPCPIGLSVAKVIAVEGRTLVLGGADIVDGSPVLDVKPFVPFCDNVPSATAPDWVTSVKPDDEPLHVGALRIPAELEATLRMLWWRRGDKSLFASFDDYRQLITEVLARDIRSVTQRVKVPQRAQQGGPGSLSGGGEAAEEEGYWKVVLDGIELGYDVQPGSADILLRSAQLPL